MRECTFDCHANYVKIKAYRTQQCKNINMYYLPPICHITSRPSSDPLHIIPLLLLPFSLCSPVLEEVLQSLADGVLLLDGQQVFQLLSEGAALDPDAGRENFCHPLQGAEHRGAGTLCGETAARQVLLRQREGRRTVLHNQGGHGATALEHGHHLLMGRRSTGRYMVLHGKKQTLR